MEGHDQPPDGALPFSDVTGLLAAAAGAEKQQALVARIYVPPSVDPATSSSVDQFAQLTSLAKQLQEYVRERSMLGDELDSQNYIWHREPPSISVASPPSSRLASSSKLASQLPSHILFHLRTGGECIEDEWLATHVLVGASAKHQLCISIEDEDGQFLLIEAAEYLPEWVTPEAVTNRVWIFDGHLHLIPPHHKSSNDGALAASRAVELVTDESIVTRTSDDIEAAAFARAYEFPSAATSHHHRTLAYLPRRIARLLAAEPQLIANCVSSIQSRDIVSSRSGSRLVHFPPPQAPQAATASTTPNAPTNESDSDIVLTSVRMTRHLYAQLLYDRFFPPRQLGPRWQAAVEKYRLRLHGHQSEAASQSKVEDEEEVQAEMQQGRWHDLGAKIWSGMEMAYTESLARRTRTRSRPLAPSDAGITAPERQRLISSLSKLGYFQGEMEGSATWKTLEAEAVAQYLKGSSTSVNGEATTDEILVCDTVDHILQQPSSTSASTILSPDASPPTLAAAEDSDSWLNLTPNDIDSILQTKTSSSTQEGAISEQDTFARLCTFNSKMESFVKTRSDARGALFEDEVDEEDMAVDDDDLLFEDLDEDEAEERVRREVEERMWVDGEGEKRRLVERLIPKMSEDEWTRRPNPTETKAGNEAKEDFVSSIDNISPNRPAGAAAGSDVKDVAQRDNNLSAAHAELRRRLASQYMRDTSTLLSSQGHEVFDGASDSDSSELEQETSPEVRRQRAEEYDLEPDVPADDVEGWEDVKMDEQTELDNLLDFARVSLGLTKEQYERILEQRREKGQFVPIAKAKGPAASSKSAPKGKETEPPKLDTFESVMSAMEEQLHTLQSSAPPPSTSTASASAPSPDPKPPTLAEKEDEELLAHLLRYGSDLPSSLLRQLGDSGKSEQMEAFLRSFQAQSGTSGPGPVDVLMRRFGLGGLPADQDTSQ